MTKRFLVTALLLAGISLHINAQFLFRITENKKIGYINQQGSVVIQPVYYNAGDFSEGCAAIRADGLYGFIDTTGRYILSPVFDMAYGFDHGVAKVYKNGECFFIDKKGQQVISSSYNSLEFITGTKAIVKTLTGKFGLLDIPAQKLVLDTICRSIDKFYGKVSIVEKYRPKEKHYEDIAVGVIDTAGKMIVPFGKYKAINPFSDGLAVVEYKNEELLGAIDTNGKEVLKKKMRSQFSYADCFHNGLLRTYLYKYWLPEKDGVVSTSDKSYQGFVNTAGNIVLDDTTLMDVYDFSNGRAFLKLDHFKYKLVDTKFNMVGNGLYEGITGNGFKNGYAIVRTKNGDGIIDTSGNYIVKPPYSIHGAGIVDNYFFTGHDGATGVADLSGKVLIEPVMEEFDRAGFVNGLIKAVVDSGLCYINKEGRIVWHEKKQEKAILTKLNIDYMNRGYFYAYSSMINNSLKESGGWYRSPNLPLKITGTHNFDSNSLTIKIDTNITDTFGRQYAGYKLFVSNTTTDTIVFKAQDSRLYMKLQAMDKDGSWRDIEYLPSSWCGNSYHTVELEPGAYWPFTIPQYQGAVTTKLRAVLSYRDGADPKKEKVIYSNTINGSINAAQFWNKRSYYPSGLMDPYFD